MARTRAHGIVAHIGVALGVGFLVLLAAPSPPSNGTSPGHASPAPVHSDVATPLASGPSTSPVPATATSGDFSLGIVADPPSICAYGLNTCPTSAATARVTMTASARANSALTWPRVEVAFVLETTPYDGVLDATSPENGGDPCVNETTDAVPLCEESNGVPFFVANAQAIASAIQAANPQAQVSFAMVDYSATLSDWDDGDGARYHVDISDFVAASAFGPDVVSTFQANVLAGGWYYPDSDLADNSFHSSSITALYGTIIGSGLNWSNDAHHVVVQIGSTAPRDPHYPMDLCITSQGQGYTGHDCMASTCEPSYEFPSETSPPCEGWVTSQDGDASHSIAALAGRAAQCTGSLGGFCTVDTIDLWDTPTDPLSFGWPASEAAWGGGPGGNVTQRDVASILLAGCDLAAATGGSWDGPAWFACPGGPSGSLEYVSHGDFFRPNTNNPTLLLALRDIGFGAVRATQVAAGASRPLFVFVPFGNIALAPALEASAACVRADFPVPTCPTTPSLLHLGSVAYLGWNWSGNAESNVMFGGDRWMASFNVIATGPPYTTVPIDACTTVECAIAGSYAVAGLDTSVGYVPSSNDSVMSLSFPLAEITVQFSPPTPLAPNLPPPSPPVPSPFPIAVPSPVGGSQPVGPTSSGVSSVVSLEAVAAGFFGAGFARVSLKNNPIAVPVAGRASAAGSIFEPRLPKRPVRKRRRG